MIYSLALGLAPATSGLHFRMAEATHARRDAGPGMSPLPTKAPDAGKVFGQMMFKRQASRLSEVGPEICGWPAARCE